MSPNSTSDGAAENSKLPPSEAPMAIARPGPPHSPQYWPPWYFIVLQPGQHSAQLQIGELPQVLHSPWPLQPATHLRGSPPAEAPTAEVGGLSR